MRASISSTVTFFLSSTVRVTFLCASAYLFLACIVLFTFPLHSVHFIFSGLVASPAGCPPSNLPPPASSPIPQAFWTPFFLMHFHFLTNSVLPPSSCPPHSSLLFIDTVRLKTLYVYQAPLQTGSTHLTVSHCARLQLRALSVLVCAAAHAGRRALPGRRRESHTHLHYLRSAHPVTTNIQAFSWLVLYCLYTA